MNSIWGKPIKELIFLVLDGCESGYIAIEGNLNLTAKGKDEASLCEAIKEVVNAHFDGSFEGIVRVRTFRDTIFTMNPPSE